MKMELFESIEMIRSKESTCQAGSARDVGSGRSPGGGNSNPFQFLAWRLTWTEEPGRLQSIGLQRIRTEGTQHIPTWEIRSITDDFSTED